MLQFQWWIGDTQPVISARDLEHPGFQQFETPFRY
jgi:hypothetical protein